MLFLWLFSMNYECDLRYHKYIVLMYNLKLGWMHSPSTPRKINMRTYLNIIKYT